MAHLHRGGAVVGGRGLVDALALAPGVAHRSIQLHGALARDPHAHRQTIGVGAADALAIVHVAGLALQARALSRFRTLAAVPAAVSVVVERTPDAAQAARLTRRMGVMFFASGAAALVYQVLFAKELALVFGSTATAAFTVLATFLGGMAIGSLIGGALAARVARPVVAYAYVELLIAAFCVATPMLFAAIQGAYACYIANGQQATFRDLCARMVKLDDETRCEPIADHREIYTQALTRQGDLTRRLHAAGYL